MPKDNSQSQGAHAFPPTQWSVVRLAVNEGREGADQALDRLCRMYERPIVAYIIRDGHSPQEAADLKQEFFAHLLAKNAFADAEGTRVKLRAFLMMKLQNFLIDQYRRGATQKRGGGKVVALGDLSEDEQRRAEPVDHVTPYIAYQRQWMQTLAAAAMRQLRSEYDAKGQSDLFLAIAPFISNNGSQSIAELSAKLGRPEGTIKSDISRLRSRCQEHIRDQIAETLDEPSRENVDAELAELMGYRN